MYYRQATMCIHNYSANNLNVLNYIILHMRNIKTCAINPVVYLQQGIGPANCLLCPATLTISKTHSL